MIVHSIVQVESCLSLLLLSPSLSLYVSNSSRSMEPESSVSTCLIARPCLREGTLQCLLDHNCVFFHTLLRSGSSGLGVICELVLLFGNGASDAFSLSRLIQLFVSWTSIDSSILTDLLHLSPMLDLQGLLQLTFHPTSRQRHPNHKHSASTASSQPY